ncbi:hypothetical protein HPP92_021251 [Vanilla planifolia]|uniref:Uncharacterized protein n=1 Tax=Vanilla planifolia TaxID=51239 RepID=A0A835PW99_VANPL|nr:hypothetical protein HPP92_021251 [Vanilla planifolia]
MVGPSDLDRTQPTLQIIYPLRCAFQLFCTQNFTLQLQRVPLHAISALNRSLPLYCSQAHSAKSNHTKAIICFLPKQFQLEITPSSEGEGKRKKLELVLSGSLKSSFFLLVSFECFH